MAFCEWFDAIFPVYERAFFGFRSIFMVEEQTFFISSDFYSLLMILEDLISIANSVSVEESLLYIGFVNAIWFVFCRGEVRVVHFYVNDSNAGIFSPNIENYMLDQWSWCEEPRYCRNQYILTFLPVDGLRWPITCLMSLHKASQDLVT